MFKSSKNFRLFLEKTERKKKHFFGNERWIVQVLANPLQLTFFCVQDTCCDKPPFTTVVSGVTRW